MKRESVLKTTSDYIKVPTALLGAVVILRVIYLGLEYYYNVSLLEFASQPLILEHQASLLEKSGHRLAAIGTTLLLAPFLIYGCYRFITRRFAGVLAKAAFGTIATFICVVIYTGSSKAQDELMTWLVERSTPEARFNAYYLNILRALLADGSVQHAGIISHSVDSFDDQLILGLLPIVLNEHDNMLIYMREAGRSVIVSRARKQALMERFPDDWQRYARFQTSLNTLWNQYADFHLENQEQLQNVQHDALQVYGATIKEMHKLYPVYKKQSDLLNSLFRVKWNDKRVTAFSDRLVDIFARKPSDPERNWLYDSLMREHFGQAVSINRWCGDSTCSRPVPDIKRIIRDIEHSRFQDSFHGVPPGLNEKRFFENARAIKAIVAMGGLLLDLPESESVTLIRFNEAYKKAVFAQVEALLSQEIERELGWTIRLPLEMNRQEFMRTPVFKSLAAKTMNLSLKGIDMDLDLDSFFEAWATVVDDRIHNSIEKLVPSDPTSFEDPKMYPVGEAAIKLAYVIPFALFLSAIMAFLNTVTLVGSLSQGIFKRRFGSLAGVASVGAVWALLTLAFFSQSNHSVMARPIITKTTQSLNESHPLLGITAKAIVSLERSVYAVGMGMKVVLPNSARTALDKHFGL